MTLGLIMMITGAVGVFSYFFLAVRERKVQDEVSRIVSDSAVRKEELLKDNETHLLPTEIADISVLKGINPEIEGFLQIEGTTVSYPVVLSDPPDKSLHRDIFGRYAYAGTVFMEPLSPENPENLILYAQWTPYCNPLVLGVQGRYFTPLLPLLAFFLVFTLQNQRKQQGFAPGTDASRQRGSYCYLLILLYNGIAVLDMASHYIAELWK